MKILVVASLSYSLINFRGALLQRMTAEGHRVTACAPEADPAIISKLAAMGVGFRHLPMDRAGLKPLRDLATLWQLLVAIRAEQPDVLLAYTQKPIVYGGIAARLSGRRIDFHAMVTGLGHLFSPGGGSGRALARRILALLYRIAVRRARRIFVFNADDEAELRRHGILHRQKVIQVPGSGVDIERFAHHPVPPAPVFLMACRLLRDKGLAEYVAAAHIVRARFPQARLQLLGPLDPNPTGVDRAELENWLAEGDVEYLGETHDIVPYLARASVFVLPSYYREGLPRVILEAMAVGRGTVTTDMPGCREPILPGRNGFLVPARDPDALAEALCRFIEDPLLARRMGTEARAIAEEVYDVRKVNELLVTEMGLHASAPPPVRPRKVPGERLALECAIVALADIAITSFAVLTASALALRKESALLFRRLRPSLEGREVGSMTTPPSPGPIPYKLEKPARGPLSGAAEGALAPHPQALATATG